MPLQPGTSLGPYQIDAPLGAGGMGEVYRARDTKLDRDVAIKELPDTVAVDDGGSEKRSLVTRARIPRGTAAWLVGLFFATGCADGTPPLLSEVRLTDPPSDRAPLAARLTVSTDEPAVVMLTVNDGVHEWSVTPGAEPDVDHSLLVLGLRPDRTHAVIVTATDAAGNESAAAPITIVTDPLPDDFPPFVVTVSDPERSEPGVTLFALRRWPDGGQAAPEGIVVAVDAAGEVVWYHRTDRSIGDVMQLQSGHLMYRATVDGIRSLLVEIDLLGNTVAQWHPRALADAGLETSTFVDTDTFHHDVIELPSCNLLALSSEVRTYEHFPTSAADPHAPTATRDVAGDTVVEFQRDGTIVREWKLLDVFDPYRVGYGSLGGGYWRTTYTQLMDDPDLADWAHTNALVYDEQDDALIAALRTQDAVVKIDAETSAIRWILGPPGGWKAPWDERLLTPTGDLEWAYHGHGAKVTPQRTILQYDNGNNRATAFEEPMPAAESYSRAVEFAVDEAAMTVSQVWDYGPDDEWFFSSFLSDADWLPTTANVLITDGARTSEIEDPTSGETVTHNWVRIVEVTHTKPAQKVFELVIDDEPPNGWRVYRAERLPGLYP